MRNDTITEVIKSSLGKKIRSIRNEKKASLKEVSLKTKLSIGALSQIERGSMVPSLSSMIRIAHSLETPMGYFCDAPEFLLGNNHKALLFKKGKERLLHSSKELHVYLLYYDEASKTEIAKAVFEKSGKTGREKVPHEGKEWGMVLKGRLKVEFGKRTYVLNNGDNICFRSDVPHRLVNNGGGRTTAIWFNSPPLWFIKKA